MKTIVIRITQLNIQVSASSTPSFHSIDHRL